MLVTKSEVLLSKFTLIWRAMVYSVYYVDLSLLKIIFKRSWWFWLPWFFTFWILQKLIRQLNSHMVKLFTDLLNSECLLYKSRRRWLVKYNQPVNKGIKPTTVEPCSPTLKFGPLNVLTSCQWWRQNRSRTHLAWISVRINYIHLYCAMTGRISVSVWVRMNKLSCSLVSSGPSCPTTK